MWKPSQCSRKMHSKGFHRMFLLSILLAFSCCVFSTVEYTCPFDIHVNKGQIIKARESVNNGASFLKHAAVLDAKECYRLCCERKNCDLAQMQYRNSTVGYFPQVEKICYMFHCGKPTKCRFGEHDHYATIVYDRPDEELSRLDNNQFGTPSVKDTKPKWNSERTQEPKSKPSVPEGKEEETDLGHDSLKPSVTQHVKEQVQHQESTEDLSSTSKQKSVDKMSEYEKKLKEFVQPQYHNKDTQEPKKTIWEEEEYFKPKETEPPQYQEVTKNEKPTKHVQIETKGPIVPVVKVTEKQKEVYVPPTEQDLDDADAELERKLEELTPSNNHQAQLAAQVVPTPATTTFHHWREFVDNNPNYPYTIPVEVEKPKMKPTTEKWREPITKRKTTKKLTTIKQQVRTEQPPKVTEKTKATEKEPAPKVQDNTHDQVAHTNKAPILEVPIKNKNVSDVVVIETQRLRIIENKAVLPLAIFLILAILLLFVVALRLRIVKSKLKRRPFATDDADYLINGMYL